MTKILLISAVFPPEPVVSALLSRDIADVLSINNKVTVLCPKPTRPKNFNFEQDYITNNYDIIRLDSYTCPSSRFIGRLHESYSFGQYCVNFLKSHSKQFDCIYINVWPLFAPFLIVRVAKKLKIPCIMHVQDMYPESLLSRLKRGRNLIFKLLVPIDRYCMKNAASIISISENLKNAIVKTRNVAPEKIVIVVNWQNESDFKDFMESASIEPNDTLKPFTFMYLGNNGPLAGVEFLIKSFQQAQIPNARLIIAGSGSRTNACVELSKSFGATNIEFIPVPDGKVPEIQYIADVMLLPVKKNGAMSSIPSKLPAYMFSAKPIIGSLDLDSDTTKAITDSGCGVVIEPENIDKLIEAMTYMSNKSKDELSEMGESGQKYAMANFTKEANLNKISELILTTAKNN